MRKRSAGLVLSVALVGPALAAAPPAEPLTLTVDEAVLLALEHNPDLAVSRLAADIESTTVLHEQSTFDPVLSLTAGKERIRGVRLSASGDRFDFLTEEWVGETKLEQLFPTGTSLEAGASTDIADEAGNGQQLVRSRLGFTITQPVLRHFGTTANLASVRRARMDVLASQYEVRGFTQQLIALVEQSYWDHALARRQLSIYEQSIGAAESLLGNIRDRIELGALPRTSTVAADAEIALRRQDLIDARAELEKSAILLLGHLDRYGSADGVRLADELDVPAAGPDAIESHVASGLCRRPDLNQARQLRERDELDVLRTRNGLLPRLDLFVHFGHTGYADTFGRAWSDLGNGSELLAGLTIERPVGNHAARASHARAAAGRRQADEAVRNLERLVQLDVRTAHVEAVRARDKVAAIAATRALDEENLEVETERFYIGRASSFQVARAQRDLVRRRLDEVEAVADYRKALVSLYRLDGSLLERRGIDVPGGSAAGGCGPR